MSTPFVSDSHESDLSHQANLPQGPTPSDEPSMLHSHLGVTSPSRGLTIAKWCGSVLLAVHVLAVFIAPASVGPSSTAVRNTWSVLSPYLHLTNLNFGYHFFAPEPGPATLVEYVAIKEDGERIWGRMPDRRTMFPRLLYHRYFMLTEFLGGMDPLDPMRPVLIESYAQQIMKNHGASSVELKMITHRLSPRERVLLGADINDPDTFDEQFLGVFPWKKN